LTKPAPTAKSWPALYPAKQWVLGMPVIVIARILNTGGSAVSPMLDSIRIISEDRGFTLPAVSDCADI